MSHLGYEKKTLKIDDLQGCVLSPLLFWNFLVVVMARALEIDEIGAVVSGNKINILKFADDIGLIADSPAELQSLIFITEVE